MAAMAVRTSRLASHVVRLVHVPRSSLGFRLVLASGSSQRPRLVLEVRASSCFHDSFGIAIFIQIPDSIAWRGAFRLPVSINTIGSLRRDCVSILRSGLLKNQRLASSKRSHLTMRLDPSPQDCSRTTPRSDSPVRFRPTASISTCGFHLLSRLDLMARFSRWGRLDLFRRCSQLSRLDRD